MERLARFREQLAETFGRLSLPQKVGLAAVSLLTIAALLWITLSATGEPHRTLYSDLTEETASKIVAELEAQQIPYELRGPTTITVPRDRLYDARLHLAGVGLPDEEGAGYELFDEAEFGMTSFTQKVNYQRALENELARTIRSIASVRAARVHLVMPEDALFEDEQKDPTASVVLSLRAGRAPEEAQIRSIRYLVASAVEGLDPSQVTLVDDNGSLLARGSGDMAMDGGGSHYEMGRKLEDDLERRLKTLLAPLVGPEHVRISVNAEIDTAQVRETSEEYDPEKTAVRSEKRSEETRLQGGDQAAGAPGAATNLPGRQNAQVGAETSSSTVADEVVNYEVSKKVRSVTQTGFGIKRLSVAVVLDEGLEKAAGAAGGKGEEAQEGEEGEEAEEGEDAAAAAAVAALPSQERVEALVKSAIGFDAERGDQVQVAYETFRPLNVSGEPEPAWYLAPDFLLVLARYLVLLALGLALLLFVVRPIVAALRGEDKEEVEEADVEFVGRTVAELEAEYGEIEAEFSPAGELSEHYEQLRAEVMELGQSDVDKTGQVIRQWIRMDNA
ncbi:flagellar M-ring protein FliF [Persicimonas caeni]|uniref:Flagellar M-ring protein n=1 Tax=Persicimonas caeni TaxID=2292766 RepID=A0A4Y6PT68_PERCE|nr:flagellar basal-body MS-ring/collar protein FliF [Persicimonas caeni]QDG51329.1 flagellar M-ring protein FliF [Persicimonas caeni]QED32550.1 flagellar M-ring protein FliF [Persicimonas caeni]